jgi:hypothetical protein
VRVSKRGRWAVLWVKPATWLWHEIVLFPERSSSSKILAQKLDVLLSATDAQLNSWDIHEFMGRGDINISFANSKSQRGLIMSERYAPVSSLYSPGTLALYNTHFLENLTKKIFHRGSCLSLDQNSYPKSPCLAGCGVFFTNQWSPFHDSPY